MKKLLVSLLASLAWLWLFTALTSEVRAEDPLEARVYAIAKKLYCPVCEQTPLDDCDTRACHDWRDLIRQKLEQGETEEEIINYFVANYGEQVLASPPPRGFNLAAWLMPGAAFGLGLAWLGRQMRRWSRRPAPPTPRPSATSEEYRRRAEEELGL